jgi:hypothetical protein
MFSHSNSITITITITSFDCILSILTIPMPICIEPPQNPKHHTKHSLLHPLDTTNAHPARTHRPHHLALREPRLQARRNQARHTLKRAPREALRRPKREALLPRTHRLHGLRPRLRHGMGGSRCREDGSLDPGRYEPACVCAGYYSW